MSFKVPTDHWGQQAQLRLDSRSFIIVIAKIKLIQIAIFSK